MSQDTRLGTTVGGYRIDSLIGRGGMSVVYLAEDANLGRRVALKFLAPELAQDAKFRERFVRESRLAASLEHPNIVTVFEAKETDGQLYLAMRYVAGTDLKRLIADEGALDSERTISILSQAASALDAAHAEGLIHRDVKPGNILIAPRPQSGERDRVYLSDFGLTKRATSDSGITATGQFVGTLDYAAPQQFESKALDTRADVYSLGCVLYECLTGEVPYPRDNQAALVYAHLYSPAPKVTDKRQDLPEAIDAVVARAMAKNPEDRYQSAGELAEAAAQALEVETVTPTTPTRPIPAGPARPIGPSRTGLLLIGVGLLAAVAVLIAGLVLASRGDGDGGTEGAPAALLDFVARVDPATRQVVARIPVGKDPLDIAVGEGSVWVLGRDGSVRRIDPVTNKTTLIETVADDPRAIVAGEGGVWVAAGTKGVLKIDPASNRIAASLRAGGTARDVAVGDGAIWVDTGGNIARIDPSSGDVSGLTDMFPIQSDLSTGARFLTAAGGGFVWEIFTEEPKLARHTLGTGQFDLIDLEVQPRAITATQGDVWLGVCGTPGTVVRIDAETGQVAATISAGGAVCQYGALVVGDPTSVAAGDEGVWVTDAVNGTVSRIRETTNQVDPPIRIGDTPTAVAVGLGSVWVTVDGKEPPSPSPS